MGGPPGAKATGAHNGFQVGFQADRTGNTTLCYPVAPRCGYPALPLVKWTSAPTFFTSPSRPWARRSTSPGVTRGTHNEVTREGHNGVTQRYNTTQGKQRENGGYITWNCWLSTKWQLVGFCVNMTSSHKVPENIKFHQHIPTPTWHLPGTYPAHEF